MTFHYTVGRAFTCALRPALSASVNQVTQAKKATSPRKRKSSLRHGRTSPRCRNSPETSRTPVDVIADDLESSTALSEVSLLVEVTSTPGAARRRSEHTSTDLESDAVVPGGSPAAEKNTDEMIEDLAVCCDADIASSVAVDDDAEENPGMIRMTRDVICQSTSSLTEPRHLAATAADRALSLFLDENLRDVMSMGFVDDASGGSGERGWMPTAGMTTMDCMGGVALGGRPLLQLGGEVSEDASSDIDVELRRIVASVAHNHNNDDINSVTSDDCGGCGTPDVQALPAASLCPDDVAPPSAAPAVSAASAVDDQILAALDSDLATSTTSDLSLVNHCPTRDCSSHATTPSGDGCSDNVASNNLNVVTCTCSGTQSNRTASGPLTVVSTSCCETRSTSTAVSSLTSAAVHESEQETTAQEEPSQHAGCDASRSISCVVVSANAAGSAYCQKQQPSAVTATTGTESCSVEEENLAVSSCEVGQCDPVSCTTTQLLSATVSAVQPRSRPKTVHENNNDITSPAASVNAESSCTLSCASGPTCCQLSAVQTSSSSGCNSLPNTTRFTQHNIGSSGSIASTTVSPRGRSSKSLEVSPKKDRLSVNCTKTSVDRTAGTASSLDCGSTIVTGSSERASVATQTNTDLLGRYFHRRTKPVSSFLGSAKHSRGSGGCGVGLKERLSSRTMSKSTVNSSSSSGSSAYHFGSTSSSSAVSTTSSVVAGGTVLLASGHQVAPLIMPTIGPLSGVNGKTTFLITVPANFSLPASVGAVIGPAGSGGSVPMSLGLQSKASVAAISGSQLVARTAGGMGSASRLTATVSSTATALVLGQSALGTPLQLLVAAATALTTASSSTGALSRPSQSSLSRQQPSGVVTLVTCSSSMLTPQSSGAQASNSLRNNVMTTKISTSLLSHGDLSRGHAVITDQSGSSVRARKSLRNYAMASTRGASTTPLQVAVRASTSTPSSVVMLPMTAAASPGSVVAVATPFSTATVSSASMMTTMMTTVPRCSPSSTVSPTSSGARHATIASLPRVAMRRRSGTSDVVVPASSSPSVHPSAVTLMNGLAHGNTQPGTVFAPSTVRNDGGGKSPVGGTTPIVVAKQPVHGEGAPASIIRAILERNLSCSHSYSVDNALTGYHLASPTPTPSPTDDVETLTVIDGPNASASDASSTIQSSSVVNQASEERRRSSVDSVLSQLASASSATVHLQKNSHVSDDSTSTRTERQNAVTRKRNVHSTHHPVSAKYCRLATGVRTTAEQLSVRNANPETDLTHNTTSRCSVATESGSPPTNVSSVDSSAVGAYGLSLSVGTSGSQQTGSNANGVSTVAYESGQRQRNETVSEPVLAVERTTLTTSPQTRVALPKKVYAYLGSAGAARENAAAAAAASVTAVGDRPFHPASTDSGMTVSATLQNSTAAAGTATGRRAASDDGPIRHLRLMCSGLAASAGGLELRSHSTA